MVRLYRETKLQQSKQRALGASCEIKEWKWQQLLQDACKCEKENPLGIPFEWQVSIVGRSGSHSRRCGFTYRQRTKAWGRVTGYIWNRTNPSFSACKTCSTEIMQHWHPDSPKDDFVKVKKHIDTAFALTNAPIPGSQNHHVMPPCVERAPPQAVFSVRHRQESSACWENGQRAKACRKLIKPQYFLKDTKLWGKKDR